MTPFQLQFKAIAIDLNIPWLHIVLNLDTNRMVFYHQSTWTRGYSTVGLPHQYSVFTPNSAIIPSAILFEACQFYAAPRLTCSCGVVIQDSSGRPEFYFFSLQGVCLPACANRKSPADFMQANKACPLDSAEPKYGSQRRQRILFQATRNQTIISANLLEGGTRDGSSQKPKTQFFGG